MDPIPWRLNEENDPTRWREELFTPSRSFPSDPAGLAGFDNDSPPPAFAPPDDQLSPERPRRAGMLDPADLKPGLVILWHNTLGLSEVSSSCHRILTEPEDGWVRMVHLDFPECGELPSPSWLADMGMAPYDDGMWRSVCWVTALR